jgi:hypothetical protein
MIHVMGTSKSVLRHPKAGDLFLARCHHNGYELQACRNYTFAVIRELNCTTNNKQDKRESIVLTGSNIDCASSSQQ